MFATGAPAIQNLYHQTCRGFILLFINASCSFRNPLDLARILYQRYITSDCWSDISMFVLYLIYSKVDLLETTAD
jgi:hypothetical protein